MKRKGFTLVEALILIFVIIVLAAFFLPIFIPTGRARPNAHRSWCQSNLKQIGLAFRQYAQDYDEVFPRAAMNNVASSVEPFSKPFGWADGIYPYLRSRELFQCRSEPNTNAGIDATQPNFTDYWMNANLSNLPLENIEEPTFVILGGDGNDGVDVTNARYSVKALPTAWRTDKNSPAWRHLDGANYLHADGHVKWFVPKRIQNKRNNISAPTFAIK